MKKLFLVSGILFSCFTNALYAQDISQNQVPSVVRNSFQQQFPKAFDVEWELKGTDYKVEFETGLLGVDHDAWFDQTGKLLRHKEEISKSDLPAAVSSRIRNDFSSYRVSDVKKITEGKKVVYTFELDSRTEEWKIVVDTKGNIVSKIAD